MLTVSEAAPDTDVGLLSAYGATLTIQAQGSDCEITSTVYSATSISLYNADAYAIQGKAAS